MSDHSEREDYENLLTHPGWQRLAQWATGEWNNQLADLVGRAAGETNDLLALTKLRQVIAARDAVRLLLEYPQGRIKQLQEQEIDRRQVVPLGRRGHCESCADGFGYGLHDYLHVSSRGWAFYARGYMGSHRLSVDICRGEAVMLKPMGDRVLIQPEEQPKQTESGLHLVEDWKPEVTGTVVALGPCFDVLCPHCDQQVRQPAQVAVGDYVVFSWSDGQEVFVDGERYLLMRESDIKAVVELEDV